VSWASVFRINFSHFLKLYTFSKLAHFLPLWLFLSLAKNLEPSTFRIRETSDPSRAPLAFFSQQGKATEVVDKLWGDSF